MATQNTTTVNASSTSNTKTVQASTNSGSGQGLARLQAKTTNVGRRTGYSASDKAASERAKQEAAQRSSARNSALSQKATTNAPTPASGVSSQGPVLESTVTPVASSSSQAAQRRSFSEQVAASSPYIVANSRNPETYIGLGGERITPVASYSPALASAAAPGIIVSSKAGPSQRTYAVPVPERESQSLTGFRGAIERSKQREEANAARQEAAQQRLNALNSRLTFGGGAPIEQRSLPGRVAQSGVGLVTATIPTVAGIGSDIVGKGVDKLFLAGRGLTLPETRSSTARELFIGAPSRAAPVFVSAVKENFNPLTVKGATNIIGIGVLSAVQTIAVRSRPTITKVEYAEPVATVTKTSEGFVNVYQREGTAYGTIGRFAKEEVVLPLKSTTVLTGKEVPVLTTESGAKIGTPGTYTFSGKEVVVSEFKGKPLVSTDVIKGTVDFKTGYYGVVRNGEVSAGFLQKRANLYTTTSKDLVVSSGETSAGRYADILSTKTRTTQDIGLNLYVQQVEGNPTITSINRVNELGIRTRAVPTTAFESADGSITTRFTEKPINSFNRFSTVSKENADIAIATPQNSPAAILGRGRSLLESTGLLPRVPFVEVPKRVPEVPNPSIFTLDVNGLKGTPRSSPQQPSYSVSKVSSSFPDYELNPQRGSQPGIVGVQKLSTIAKVSSFTDTGFFDVGTASVSSKVPSFIPLQPISVSGISVQRTTGSSTTRTIPKSTQQPLQTPVQIPSQIQKPIQIPIQVPIPIQKPFPGPKPPTPNPLPTGGEPGFSIPGPGFGLPGGLPGLGGGGGGGSLSRFFGMGKKKEAYIPSFAAAALGITTRKAQRSGGYTGLEIRPIVAPKGITQPFKLKKNRKGLL